MIDLNTVIDDFYRHYLPYSDVREMTVTDGETTILISVIDKEPEEVTE